MLHVPFRCHTIYYDPDICLLILVSSCRYDLIKKPQEEPKLIMEAANGTATSEHHLIRRLHGSAKQVIIGTQNASGPTAYTR